MVLSISRLRRCFLVPYTRVLRLRGLAALLLLLGLASCLRAKPVQRLQTPQAISVAVVHDYGSGLGNVPEALKTQVELALGARNLEAKMVPRSQYEDDFASKRATRDRLQSLQTLQGSAPMHLLVETRAEFYSQLVGRYRWTVYVKLSLAKAGDSGPPRVSNFSFPVTLSFDHQREEEALAEAAGSIARKLGGEVDDFLAGMELSTKATERGRPSAAQVPQLESIYFVMVDRFANGNTENDGEVDLSDPQAFHGGDLSGLIDKLDHIQSLGFRTLWLSPLFSMRTEKIGEHGAFHGYWTEDLRKVEARFGESADLLRLKEELARRDMSLVLDMVLNHVGYDTKFVSEHPSWFHDKGDIKDWQDPVQLTTHDVHGLPDLAQENPEVYDYLLSASAQWIEDVSPIGFRLDAVKHVGRDFWTQYTRDLQKKSQAPLAMIGELYNGDPATIAAGFREDGFSHLFDFPLYFAMNEVFCKGEDVRRLAAILSLDRLYPDPSRLITFADNHDLPRVWSACGEDSGRVEALLTFMMSARGIPSVNYGTEVGLSGASEPENRKDMRFGDDQPFAELIRKMLALRSEHPLFHSGRSLPLHVGAERFAYYRVGEEEVALVLLNMGTKAWVASIQALREGTGLDALSGKELSAGNVTVSSGASRVILLNSKSPAVMKMLREGDDEKLEKVVVVATAEPSDLRLVGGGPELGGWKPEAAPRGKLLPDGRYQFELMLPAQSTSAFKLVRMVEGEAQWEKRGNRFVTAEPKPGSPLEVHFGKTAGEIL